MKMGHFKYTTLLQEAKFSSFQGIHDLRPHVSIHAQVNWLLLMYDEKERPKL